MTRPEVLSARTPIQRLKRQLADDLSLIAHEHGLTDVEIALEILFEFGEPTIWALQAFERDLDDRRDT